MQDEEANVESVEERSALLTQITDPESYYEQYTVYPICEKRISASSSALYQMLKIHDVCMDNRFKSLDLLYFPDLYPYGINGQNEDRYVPLKNFEFIRSRLMSKHCQFRLNQQYIFYLLNDVNIRQLSSGIFHKLNVVNPRERYTAKDYLDQMSKEQLESSLSTIFSRLRNSEQYWRKSRCDVRCMTLHYGPATWFLTLSPSEWLWTDLGDHIRSVNGPAMRAASISELVAADPVSASRFIDNKFRAMLDFICSPDNPIGEVTHYFWRREYQGRGLPHFHMLIWVKDAPILGKSDKADIIKFISKYVTCKLPNENVSPTLSRRVRTHQMHKDNSYCLRKKNEQKKKR